MITLMEYLARDLMYGGYELKITPDDIVISKRGRIIRYLRNGTQDPTHEWLNFADHFYAGWKKDLD